MNMPNKFKNALRKIDPFIFSKHERKSNGIENEIIARAYSILLMNMNNSEKKFLNQYFNLHADKFYFNSHTYESNVQLTEKTLIDNYNEKVTQPLKKIQTPNTATNTAPLPSVQFDKFIKPETNRIPPPKLFFSTPEKQLILNNFWNIQSIKNLTALFENWMTLLSPDSLSKQKMAPDMKRILNQNQYLREYYNEKNKSPKTHQQVKNAFFQLFLFKIIYHS